MDHTSNPTSADLVDSTEEEFNRTVEVFNTNQTQLSVEYREQLTTYMKEHWTKLTHDEKYRFLKTLKERLNSIDVLKNQAAENFIKATDEQLMDAATFIEDGNLAKIAMKYLGLSMDQINGLNVFKVLKKWRDEKPYQGSKQVQYLTGIHNILLILTFLFKVSLKCSYFYFVLISLFLLHVGSGTHIERCICRWSY